MKGFSGLDGKAPDMRPLARRQEILAEGISQEGLLNEALLKNEQGVFDEELMAVESYALSGLIIERMWDDFKSRPETYSTPDTPRVLLDETFWKNFTDRYISLEQSVKDAVMERGDVALRTPIEIQSAEDRLFARYFVLQMKRVDAGFQERLGRPSFIDFFSIYMRLARAAGETYAAQCGHEPSRMEYEHMLSDTSFQGMMLQMMMNTREALGVVMARLEGTIGFNTNDTSRKFLTDDFVIQQKETGPVLQPNEETLQMIRDGIQVVMKKYMEQGKKIPQVLRCPVMDTGKFGEMCDWLRHEINHHYFDQKYPQG